MAYHPTYGCVPDDVADEMCVIDRGDVVPRTAAIEWIALTMAQDGPRTPAEAPIFSRLREATPEHVARHYAANVSRAAEEFLKAVEVCDPHPRDEERKAHANHLLALHAKETARIARINAETAQSTQEMNAAVERFAQALQGAAA